MNQVAAIRARLRLGAVAFGLVMIDGYDTLMPTFVAPVLGLDLQLNRQQMGVLLASALAGSMIGGALLGRAADRLGRRPVVFWSTLAAGLGTLLCSQMASLNALILVRFLSGIALGGALSATISLVAESTQVERRSTSVTGMFIGYPLGVVLGGAVTAGLLSLGWRTVFAGAGILTTIYAPATLLLSETLRGGADQSTDPGPMNASLKDMLRGHNPLATALSAGGIFGLLLVVYLLNTWLPLMASAAGFNPKVGALSTVFLNLGGIVGAAVSAILVARMRLFTIVNGLLASGAVLLAAFGLFFASPATLLGGAFAAGFLIIGGQLNCPSIVARLYPKSQRAGGVGLQLAAGRLGSIAGPLLGASLLSSPFHVRTAFLPVAAVTLAAAACFVVLGTLRIPR